MLLERKTSIWHTKRAGEREKKLAEIYAARVCISIVRSMDSSPNAKSKGKNRGRLERGIQWARLTGNTDMQHECERANRYRDSVKQTCVN